MRWTQRPRFWPRRPPAASVAAVLLLAGCAGAPPAPPKVERLSAEQVEALLPQPASAIGLADIVAMSRAGSPPADIIRRLDAVQARFRLSATQLLELQRDGVAPAVLDHMVAAERRALFDDFAADLARREQACVTRIEAAVRQCHLQSTPMCWPPAPGFPFWRCI